MDLKQNVAMGVLDFGKVMKLYCLPKIINILRHNIEGKMQSID